MSLRQNLRVWLTASFTLFVVIAIGCLDSSRSPGPITPGSTRTAGSDRDSGEDNDDDQDDDDDEGDGKDRPGTEEFGLSKRELVRQVSKNFTAWALGMAERVGSRMREIGQRGYMATKVLDELDSADKEILENEVEIVSREWIILTTLEEDLLDPNRVVDLWREKELIEQLVETNRTYSNEDIENMYPPITDDYKQRLAGCVRGEG